MVIAAGERFFGPVEPGRRFIGDLVRKVDSELYRHELRTMLHGVYHDCSENSGSWASYQYQFVA
jgi:hypothetical protein